VPALGRNDILTGLPLPDRHHVISDFGFRISDFQPTDLFEFSVFDFEFSIPLHPTLFSGGVGGNSKFKILSTGVWMSADVHSSQGDHNK
jgi:hypothetical protein